MPHLTWDVNLGMIVANVLLTLITVYVRRGMSFLRDMSYRVNVMWAQFGREHPELVRHHIRKSDIPLLVIDE